MWRGYRQINPYWERGFQRPSRCDKKLSSCSGGQFFSFFYLRLVFWAVKAMPAKAATERVSHSARRRLSPVFGLS